MVIGSVEKLYRIMANHDCDKQDCKVGGVGWGGGA